MIPACGLISGLGDLEIQDADAGVDAEVLADTSPPDVVAEAASDAKADIAADGPTIVDASVPDVAKDTGPDVGSDASTGIQCGAAPKTCALSSPICCFDQNAKSFACSSSACVSPIIPIECDFDSCGVNEVCCRRGGGTVSSVKCESLAACPGTSNQATWMCNSLAPVCPGGKSCQQSSSLPGYYVCF